MSRPVIKVERIGKEYVIGARQRRPQNLAELAKALASAPLRRLRALSGQVPDEERFWALKDVSFEVGEGEVVGIIGRNGAGKSTLLKILSRITEPSEGRIEIRGRVSSLLEVGTGFHPMLTGRENIFLNGAILGMSRAEIRRKFDEIVDFSGVEKFIDTPVRRYSSGMKVRLAFAVAAHLEPEVLIIDEVLAVGDAEFQRKCLGKMQDVANIGRTVLFVSHNLVAVRTLCERGIVLADGAVVADADTGTAINAYRALDEMLEERSSDDLSGYETRYGSGELKVVSARLLDERGAEAQVLQRLSPAAIEFTVRGVSSAALNLSATCATSDGVKVLQLDHHDAPGFDPGTWAGERTVRISIPSLPLQCGYYDWTIAVHSMALLPIDVVSQVLPFRVDDDLTKSRRPYRSVAEHGFCTLTADWSLLSVEAMKDAV